MAQSIQYLYEFGPFRLDIAKRRLLRDGQVVQLTPKCFDILLTLVERSGEVVSKDELITRVWPDSFVEEGNLTYSVSMLRQALGERAGERQYILTAPGRGYQFVETVKPLLNERAGAEVTERTLSAPVSKAKEAANGQESVSVKEPASERLLDDSSINAVAQHKRKLMIAVAALVIAASGISYWLYKLILGKGSPTNLAEPFHRMRMTRLTTTGQARVAAISPDGKYVAYAMGGPSQQGLWLRHIATGSDTEIVPTAPVNYTVLTFSPDGNFIYFLRVESLEGWNPL